MRTAFLVSVTAFLLGGVVWLGLWIKSSTYSASRPPREGSVAARPAAEPAPGPLPGAAEPPGERAAAPGPTPKAGALPAPDADGLEEAGPTAPGEPAPDFTSKYGRLGAAELRRALASLQRDIDARLLALSGEERASARAPSPAQRELQGRIVERDWLYARIAALEEEEEETKSGG